MKLRMRKNFLNNAWEKAVWYRKWQLEEIERFTDRDAIDHWGSQFNEQLGLLVLITTESACTLHDMATFEAQEQIQQDKKLEQIREEFKKELLEAVA